MLRVLDDSMAPEFRPGCMIVVDPTGRATDGAYVVAEVEGEIRLRRLRCEGGQAWLEALDCAIPTRPIGADLAVIMGVVTQRAGTRRRDHKRYDV